MARITLRIDFGESRALGPGKVRPLELVGETGSISAAGRATGMSYRRAWLLVDALNQTFRMPVVQTRGGGVGGGGGDLTPFGAGSWPAIAPWSRRRGMPWPGGWPNWRTRSHPPRPDWNAQ